MPARICAACSKPAALLCSSCQDAWYCSKACQIKDFDSHEPICGMWYFWYTKYSVVDRIKKKNYLSTLYKLLVSNELSNALSQTGKNFTVFAPTDRAFERITDTVAKLSASQVKEVLLYHVHSGSAVDSKQAIKLGMSNTAIPMMQGLQATLRTEGKKLYINNAQVVKPDMRAYNGVVHIIDTVLVPPSFST